MSKPKRATKKPTSESEKIPKEVPTQLESLVRNIIHDQMPKPGFLKTHWVAIVSLIVSIVSIVFTVLNYSATVEQNYDTNSNALRPEIRIMNDSTSIDYEPVSKEFYSNFDKEKFLQEIKRKQASGDMSGTSPYWYFTPNTKVKVRVDLKLQNVSLGAKADILFVCMASAGKDTTVKVLLDRFMKDSLLSYSDSSTVYENPLVINEMQENGIDGNVTVIFEDGICAFHYLIVYKNELGCYYASYVIVKYKFEVYFPLFNTPIVLANTKISIDDIVTYTRDIKVKYSLIDKPYYLPVRFNYDEANRIEEMFEKANQ